MNNLGREGREGGREGRREGGKEGRREGGKEGRKEGRKEGSWGGRQVEIDWIEDGLISVGG